MQTHANKSQEHKSQSVANEVQEGQREGESTFQFQDDRPASIAQRKFQEKANNHSSQQTNPFQKKKNKTGLPDSLKSGIENLSGYSMDDVKVHYNSDKPAQLQAHAYAQGSDIHLASGQEKHLAHEAWHVVQQKQGRVKPTMQLNGNVNLNDDASLEKEADVMGEKSFQRKAKLMEEEREKDTTVIRPEHKDTLNNHSSLKTNVVQAVMSLAEFQAATPKELFKPRDTITAVDTAIARYHGTKNHANAVNLYNVAHNYATSHSDATRRGVAAQVRNDVENERDLLAQIGDVNSHLVDGLIAQATPARIAQLITLASDAGVGGANALPAIIDEIGPANIHNLNASGAVGVMGAANISLLPAMIRNSGGVAELVDLYTVVNRHAGQGDLAFDLAREAGGNAAEFNRFTTQLPFFQQNHPVAPAAPAAVNAARIAYNAAKGAFFAGGSDADITAELAVLVAQATAAHAQATALGGIAGGLLGTVNARIAALNARVVARQGGGPAHPNDIVLANNLQNIVAGGLDVQMTNHHPGDAAFAAALLGTNTAHTNATRMEAAVAAVAGGAAAPPDIAQVSWKHFMERHTPDHFDFGTIKDENTQWVPAWGAAANVNVANQLTQVITDLTNSRRWLDPNVAIQNHPVPMGSTATIAGEMRAAGFVIGQFFPNPGNGNSAYSGSTMRAMAKVV